MFIIYDACIWIENISASTRREVQIIGAKYGKFSGDAFEISEVKFEQHPPQA